MSRWLTNLIKDAARYQWIRSHNLDDLSGDELDAAIDKAMADELKELSQ